MFFIQLLMLCACALTMHAADDNRPSQKSRPLSGQQIDLQFGTEKEKSFKYPLEFVSYFETPKGVIEDIGADFPIPLEQVTKETFNCLIDFTKELWNQENYLEDARTKFQTIKQLHPSIAEADLLIQTNYLNPSIEIFDKKSEQKISFKNLIASLYADSLKTNPFNLTEINQIPPELTYLPAAWIVHNLLTEFATHKFDAQTMKNYPYAFKKMFQPTLCQSSTLNGFGYVWNQSVDQLHHDDHLHGIVIDFAKNILTG